MASVDLVFQAATATTADLVFGDDGSADIRDSIVSGSIALARPTLFGRVSLAVVASGSIVLARPRLSGEVIYNSDTERPLVARVAATFQAALPLESGVESRIQDAAPLPIGVEVRYRDAAPAQADVRTEWEDATATRSAAHTRFQDATAVSVGAQLGYQDGLPVGVQSKSRLQDALRLDGSLLGIRFQEATATRTGGRVRFQDGLPYLLGVQAFEGFGAAIEVGKSGRYQEAILPQPGVSPPTDPGVEPEDPCYVPSGDLVFSAPWVADTNLVFFCERHDGGTDPGQPPLFIPLLKVYMATHSLQAVLLPGLERVPLLDVNISADADSPTWSLTATGPMSLLDQLRSSTNAPRQIRVTLDGMPWVFAVDGFARSRRPGERRVRITGHSVTSLLGATTLPAQTWLNGGERTAEQLVLDALEFSGVAVDWQLPAWLVPAGAWSFQGKPLAAAVRIAAAVDAVLQSHPYEPTLQFLPRYPRMPWEWMDPSTVPDVSIPSAVITLDELEMKDEPEWEVVYVYGTTQGVGGRVFRGGTAASVQAPQVTDDLITDIAAARERGRAVLGRGGRQADLSISMPILTGGTLPGALRVNQLLEVTEPSETWRSMVRGVSIVGGPAATRQTLRAERHFV